MSSLLFGYSLYSTEFIGKIAVGTIVLIIHTAACIILMLQLKNYFYNFAKGYAITGISICTIGFLGFLPPLNIYVASLVFFSLFMIPVLDSES